MRDNPGFLMLQVQLARYGAGALQQTFADADEDYSGRLSFSQLEGPLVVVSGDARTRGRN